MMMNHDYDDFVVDDDHYGDDDDNERPRVVSVG